MTTVSEQARAFVSRLAGEPVRDHCIAEKLGLAMRQHAGHEMRELAGEAGFERDKQACALRGAARPTVRRALR